MFSDNQGFPAEHFVLYKCHFLCLSREICFVLGYLVAWLGTAGACELLYIQTKCSIIAKAFDLMSN